MLKAIFIILFVLWLLGMVSANTMGGFLHILLVLAVGLFLIRIIQGKSPF
ncbi:MAG: lmo0937 family membrane protein [Tindallia sp. MSAO_Bac2]|nr:MAG: lmo0937 family membrane protein [Tindallia sp. MSAO_Bac2]